jgi:hypothetical protein
MFDVSDPPIYRLLQGFKGDLTASKSPAQALITPLESNSIMVLETTMVGKNVPT